MAPILEVYTLDELEQIQVGVPRTMLLLMISYFAVFLMALGVYLGIAWYERKRQKGADELDLEDARESIIMPFHKPLILFVMGVSLSMGITVGLAPVPTSLTEGELLYAMRNFSVNVVVWTMQYPAVSRSTTLKAIAWATLFSLVPIPIIYAVEQHRPLGDVYLALLFVRTATAGHYVYNLLWPPTSRGAASSIRWYSGLGLLYTLLVMAYHMAFKYHYFAIGYNCVYAASSFLVFSPLFLYNIFREDTKFWRGAHAVFPPSREFRQIVARFKNLTADEVDAYDEAVRRMIVDAATVILNFASLEFKVPHSVEGVGRTATVASGLLHGYDNMEPQRVAIKTFNPELFLADEVAKVALETSIATLPTMRNKYIVHGFGLAVHPPALCLVNDLCEMSLASHLRAKGLGLSLRVRLTYMLHCAKGVGWTHANMVLHRDVRPANFFVQTLFETQDLQKIIKLSDFGDAIFVDDLVTKAPRPVAGTLCYMAPEVMRGATVLYPHRNNVAYYNASADIFSLTMTFWDILHPNAMKDDKFGSSVSTPEGQRRAADKMLHGFRPDLSKEVLAVPGLKTLFHEGWSDNPKIVRPTAVEIVGRLKAMLDGNSAVYHSDNGSNKAPATKVMTKTGSSTDESLSVDDLPVYQEFYDV